MIDPHVYRAPAGRDFLPALSVQGIASPALFPTVSHHIFICLGSPSHTEPQDLLLQMVARPLTVVLHLILLFHSRHYNLTTSSRAECAHSFIAQCGV